MKTDQEADRTLIERLKELNCLLKISKLLARHDVDLQLILQQTVSLLPRAFQDPDHTCARIVYQGNEYISGNLCPGTEGLQEHIYIDRNPAGLVEVCFSLDKPLDSSTRFLKEEKRLLSAIADQIGMVLAKKASGTNPFYNLRMIWPMPILYLPMRCRET
jgi:hypothetical protein